MAETPSEDQPGLRAFLLGQARVFVGERDLFAGLPPSRSGKALLIYLLLAPGRAATREQVCEALWPHLSKGAAANALAKALSALRQACEPARTAGIASRYLASDRERLWLRPEIAIWVDALQFEESLNAPRFGAAERRDGLDRALALWQGDLLATELDAEWAEARRARLRALRRDAVLARAGADLDAGRTDRAIADLQRLLHDDELDEPAHRLLIRVWLATGDRARARRQLDRCRAALARELGVEPEDATTSLLLPTATASPPAVQPQPASRPRRYAPPAPPGPLIGRERVLDEVIETLQRRDVRLVTLIGPGGVGKTRLSLEVARLLGPEFEAGACFVPLASLERDDQVVAALARAFGVAEAGSDERTAVTTALTEHELLLVFDNCEHLPALNRTVAELLAAHPTLRVLASSRSPLGLRAEYLYPLPPLDLPDPKRPTRPDVLGRVEAVALFVERAQATQPHFALTDQNAVAAAAICARLDGLPLAIELAAAHLRTGSPETLLADLERGLDALAGGFADMDIRHQTMRATIAWSYDRLGPNDRLAFRHLAVCAGGFGLPLASALCEMGAQAVTTLADQSLIRRFDGDAGPRFEMLETIRAYGLERLEAAGEADSARASHADYCLALAEEGAQRLLGAAQVEWLARLRDEDANLESALAWTIARLDLDRAARFCAALSRYWQICARFEHGLAWADRLLALSNGEQSAPGNAWIAALAGAGTLANRAGKLERARALHEQAQSLAQGVGDPDAEARALVALGALARRRGEVETADRLLREALTHAQSTGNERAMADALNGLGILADLRGDHAAERAHFAAALARYEAIGDAYGISIVRHNLGDLDRREGRLDQAVAQLEEVLRVARAMESNDGVASTLLTLAGIWLEQGELARAARAAGEGIALLRAIGGVDYLAAGLVMAAEIALRMGDRETARARAHEGLTVALELDEPAALGIALDTAGGILLADGDASWAAWLHGTTAAARTASGTAPDHPSAHDRHVEQIRAALPAREYAAATTAGAAVSLAEAALRTLAVLTPPVDPGSVP